jgi:hypothetical protein
LIIIKNQYKGGGDKDMSVKEEIIEKTMIIRDLKKDGKRNKKIKEECDIEKSLFKNVKRKSIIMLPFLFFLLIILIFMILPTVIAAITQGLWG